MTALDNIKTNNWPSSTTDPFEDFCVMKLPLNDSASLTSSLPVVVGSKEISPKATFTNVGVSLFANQGRVWDSILDTNSSNDLPLRSSRTIADAFGPTPFQVETASNGVGRIIYLDFANNGGALTGSTLLIDGTGFTSSFRDVYINGSSTKAGNLDDLLDISGQTVNNVQIKSNASNAGAGFAGIELDGVRLVNNTHAKYYDETANFSSSVLTTTAPVPRGGAPRTLEFWAYLNSGASSWQNIISYGSSGGSQCFGINRGNSDTSNIAFTGFSGGDWDTGVSVSSYLNTWTHFSVTYESGTVEIFLNGTSIGTAGRTLNTGGSTFVVGGSEHSGNNERFSGKIQDVRVYNKRIRTVKFTPPSAILG